MPLPITYTTDMRDFIRQIQRQQKRTGMTMTELARASEVSRPYLYRILAGKQVPSLDVAERIADALELRIKTTAK